MKERRDCLVCFKWDIVQSLRGELSSAVSRFLFCGTYNTIWPRPQDWKKETVREVACEDWMKKGGQRCKWWQSCEVLWKWGREIWMVYRRWEDSGMGIITEQSQTKTLHPKIPKLIDSLGLNTSNVQNRHPHLIPSSKLLNSWDLNLEVWLWNWTLSLRHAFR